MQNNINRFLCWTPRILSIWYKNIKLKKTIKWIIPILNKHVIPYQIAGGFGAYLYGGKRPINDIDIDIPNEKFSVLLPFIKKYIIYGPARYKDEKWDLDLITLDYEGQLVDISGANDAKIYDEIQKVWRPYPKNYKSAHMINIYGLDVSVMNPNDLIAYKKLLNGEHQQEDIATMEKFVEKINIKK